MLKGLPKLMRQARQTTQPLPPPATATFKRIDQWIEESHTVDLAQMSDATIWQQIRDVWEERYFQMLQRHNQVSQQAFVWTALLQAAIRFFNLESQHVLQLMSGVSEIQSAAMGKKMQAIAETIEQAGLRNQVLEQSPAQTLAMLADDQQAQATAVLFHELLKLYGHHCIAEAELLTPRWVEQPTDLIDWLQQYLQRNTKESTNPTTESPSIKSGSWVAQKVVHWVLNRSLKAIRVRDNSRFFLAKLNLQRRKHYAELGQRWFNQGLLSNPDLIFFLVHEDIAATIEAGMHDQSPAAINQLARERQLAFEFWSTQSAPNALDWQEQVLAPVLQIGKDLQGLGASPGIVEGTVRILEHPNQQALDADDIIVTRSVDPSWTPLFGLVKGLVLEIGGQLSHGAIVAREYGIPAVVNVPHVLTTLRSGEKIRIDGNLGIIYRHETDE